MYMFSKNRVAYTFWQSQPFVPLGQGYLVFGSGFDFRLHKLTFFRKIASMQKYAEIPKQKPQAKTLAPTEEKYSQILK